MTLWLLPLNEVRLFIESVSTNTTGREGSITSVIQHPIESIKDRFSIAEGKPGRLSKLVSIISLAHLRFPP